MTSASVFIRICILPPSHPSPRPPPPPPPPPPPTPHPPPRARGKVCDDGDDGDDDDDVLKDPYLRRLSFERSRDYLRRPQLSVETGCRCAFVGARPLPQTPPHVQHPRVSTRVPPCPCVVQVIGVSWLGVNKAYSKTTSIVEE